MDEVLKEASRQVPSLVVLVVLVVLFLRRMTASDETQRTIAAACHETQQQAMRAVEALEERSAGVIKENTEALGAMRACLERVERRLDREEVRP